MTGPLSYQHLKTNKDFTEVYRSESYEIQPNLNLTDS